MPPHSIRTERQKPPLPFLKPPTTPIQPQNRLQAEAQKVRSAAHSHHKCPAQLRLGHCCMSVVLPNAQGRLASRHFIEVLTAQEFHVHKLTQTVPSFFVSLLRNGAVHDQASVRHQIFLRSRMAHTDATACTRIAVRSGQLIAVKLSVCIKSTPLGVSVSQFSHTCDARDVGR